MDVARVETAEKELDVMIERRTDRRPDPDEREELWRASVRVHDARRREEMRAAWCEYHRLAVARHRAVLESLIAHHEAQAEKLQANRPKGDAA